MVAKDGHSALGHERPTFANHIGAVQLGSCARTDGLLRQLGEAFEEMRLEIEILQEQNCKLRARVQEAGHLATDDHDPPVTYLPTSNAAAKEAPAPSKRLEGGLAMSEVQTFDAEVCDHAEIEEMYREPEESSVIRSDSKNRSQNPLHAMLPLWQQSLTERSVTDFGYSQRSHTVMNVVVSTPVQGYSERWKNIIIFPSSPSRLVWDIVGFLFIFFDLISIPLRVFSPPEGWFTLGMAWVSLLYWTLNVPATLMVGYVDQGITIMNPKKILENYLKTWFVLDMIVLVPDWYMTIEAYTSRSANPEDAVQLLRLLRLTKWLRLLRAARLKKIMQQLKDRIASEYTGIIVNMMKQVCLLLFVNHYIAAFWFAIGSLNGPFESWVRVYKRDQQNWFENYLFSLHWSVTQFSPSSKVPLDPQNPLERSFAILVVIFALVGFSYILGSITGSLAQLRALAEDADKQFWQVRRYLRQHDVSPQLSGRIQRFLEHAYAKSRQKTDLSRIPILGLLSSTLRSELRLEVARPQMKMHPLFAQLNESFAPTLRRIAISCISYQDLAHGDVLFFPGETGTHMYFLVAGLLQYSLASTDDTQDELVEGREDWIAEPVLWSTSWIHRGTPVAIKDSEVLHVSPESFARVVCLNPAAFRLVSSYAHNFLHWLEEQDQSSLSDIYQGESLFDQFSYFCVDGGDEVDMPTQTTNSPVAMRLSSPA